MNSGKTNPLAHPTQMAGRPIGAASFRVSIMKTRHMTSVERLTFVVQHNWTYNSVLEARYLNYRQR